MSKYQEIKTEYRNLESLKKALNDMGIAYEVSKNWRNPDIAMYGYHNDVRPERASIRIDRNWVNDNWSGCASNDIGFAWDGKQFNLILSDYDSRVPRTLEAMNKLRQRYGFNEAMRLAHAKGYTAKETTFQDGTIRIVLQRR